MIDIDVNVAEGSVGIPVQAAVLMAMAAETTSVIPARRLSDPSADVDVCVRTRQVDAACG
jgi:hypothetical protein